MSNEVAHVLLSCPSVKQKFSISDGPVFVSTSLLATIYATNVTQPATSAGGKRIRACSVYTPGQLK